MTDQAKLTAEEIVRSWALEFEMSSTGNFIVHNPAREDLITRIRQAEDAVREEMSKPPTVGCCGGEVILHPARIHHKEGCPIKTQAIREGK